MKSAGNKILVVEDDDDWTNIIGLLLGTAGYLNVKFTASGRGALNILKTFTPDCITIDLQLSDQDGSMLIRRIREQPLTANVPVVILTNYPKEKVSSLKAGADHFVSKNPNGEEFLATLQSLFRRRDMDAGIRRMGDVALQPEHGEVFLNGDLVAALTPKAFELFAPLIWAAGLAAYRRMIRELLDNTSGGQ